MKYTRLFDLAKEEWKTLSLGTLFLFMSSGLNLSFPLIIGKLIDGIDQGGGQEIVNQYAMILLAVFAVVGVATFFRAYGHRCRSGRLGQFRISFPPPFRTALAALGENLAGYRWPDDQVHHRGPGLHPRRQAAQRA